MEKLLLSSGNQNWLEQGRVCHLSERDCSFRDVSKNIRRVIIPFMTDKLRDDMGRHKSRHGEI